MIRFNTKDVKIGNCPMGANHPIRVQSMTNTPALDVAATVEQTKRIFDAGADYVRISTPSRQSAESLSIIRQQLNKQGYLKPLVADIHFNASLALIAARKIEKVRINPGNYTSASKKNQTNYSPSEVQEELEKTRENLKPLVTVCKEYGTAIRVGTNFGSLSPRIVSQYGNTPQGMVQSTIEFLQILEDLGFDQTVISLKASSPLITVQSYWMMVQKMIELGMSYPLHLGVTEAGEGEDGRIVSALGIGSLLNAGIGDTIRVSLSESPEAEIPVALELVRPFNESFSIRKENVRPFHLENFQLQTENLPELPANHKSIVVRVEGNLDDFEILTVKTLNGDPSTATPDILIEPAKDQDIDEPNFVLSEKNLLKKNIESSAKNVFISVELPLADNVIDKIGELKSPVILIGKQPPAKVIEDFWLDLQKRKINSAIIPIINPSELPETSFLNFIATNYGALLLQRKIGGIAISSPLGNDCIQEIKTTFGLLQASGSRITNTQFISCPTCARTSFDMVEVVKQVKQVAAGLPGLKIAVMGCIVNGPGEMADADFGILGVGRNMVTIYKGKEPVIKNIPQSKAAEALVNLIGRS